MTANSSLACTTSTSFYWRKLQRHCATRATSQRRESRRALRYARSFVASKGFNLQGSSTSQELIGALHKLSSRIDALETAEARDDFYRSGLRRVSEIARQVELAASSENIPSDDDSVQY